LSDILPLPAILVAKKQARVRRRSHWLIRIFVARWMDLGLSMSACLPIRYAPSAVNMCYLHDPKLFRTETKSGAWPAGARLLGGRGLGAAGSAATTATSLDSSAASCAALLRSSGLGPGLGTISARGSPPCRCPRPPCPCPSPSPCSLSLMLSTK